MSLLKLICIKCTLWVLFGTIFSIDDTLKTHSGVFNMFVWHLSHGK